MQPGASEQPTAPAPSTVLAIDCGTSAVRAYVAELSESTVRILEDLRHPVTAPAALRENVLDRRTMDDMAEALRAILRVGRDYGITHVRAVGTAALRLASNADVFLERVRMELGLELDVIDGGEEARLYWEALREVLRKDGREIRGRIVMMNVGAGHTSTCLIDDGLLVHAVDDHFGTLRVYEQFRGLRDSLDFLDSIERITHGTIAVALGRLPRGRIDGLVVTGSEVRQLAGLLLSPPHPLVVELSGRAVTGWFHSMRSLTPPERAAACGLDAHAASLLLPAAALVGHLCAETRNESVLVPHLTLRDGLIADLLPGSLGPHHLGREHLLAAARALAAQYGMDLGYAENTASLARQIFDQTTALHRCGDRERTLLEMAALLHDVGSFINIRNRHKHTLYVLQSADLAGLTLLEKQIVAHVARYHRRSAPKASHASFVALPRTARVLVSKLAAILRLAYGLDVERTQRIRRVRVMVENGRLLLLVDQRQISLEEWSIREKSGLFFEVFGVAVKVAPMEEE